MWIRYALRANQQVLYLETRNWAEGGEHTRVPILDAAGYDKTNGVFERLDIALTPDMISEDTELVLVLTTGDDGELGLDLSEYTVGSGLAAESLAAPVEWTFEGDTPNSILMVAHGSERQVLAYPIRLVCVL